MTNQRVFASILLLAFAAGIARAAEPAHSVDFPTLDALIRTHCADCHSEHGAEGGLDLYSLSRDLSTPASLAKWVRVHDRVASGEMPPADADQPSDPQRRAFTDVLAASLTTAHAAQKGTVLRRLNRREYENTLNDLFGTHLDLATMLPEDGRSHEFDTVGQALGISMVQMQRYLELAERVLDEAIAKSLAPPESKVVRASYADTRGAEQWLGKIWLHRPDGAVVFFQHSGYPSGMLREANVRQDGWYMVRVTGYAWQSETPIPFALGATTFARGAETPTFGYRSLPPGRPTTVELRAYIKSGYMIQITPQGINDRNNQIRQQGVEGYAGPGLAIQHVEVEGPLVDQFPSRGHHLLFDGLNRQEIPPRNPNDRRNPRYVPKFEIDSADPLTDVTPVLQRIASRAFRRPVATDQLTAWLALFESALSEGASFEDALRSAATAILCSPEFLYLRERPGRLDDYALASRLSYFLTRTAPDDQLLASAQSGRLSTDDAELRRQTERLLNHPHQSRFIEDFTDAWLNLREIEFTNPDQALFPEFDRFLQHSMLDESRAFFAALLRDDLGVRNVVKSDFAMLNERLAEHYGIGGVSGPEIRRVALPAESVRGGFLSQGSVLKVSANGTNTSPIVRGVWVMERILGETPSPPPPGIPGVEPDIRGATTLRELLDKHRNVESCRNCHQVIDPPGFALESFDPIGGWRERFRSLGEGEQVQTEVRGSRVRYRLGPPVDASGELPDGRAFGGFAQFRDLLAEDEAALARAFAVKLLTFGTGREMGFSDREEIERIVRQSAADGHGVRSLIHHVVASDLFRSK